MHVCLGRVCDLAGVFPVSIGATFILAGGVLACARLVRREKVERVEPCKDAHEVPVQNRFPLVVREAQYCPCGVRAYSRQCFQFLACPRHCGRSVSLPNRLLADGFCRLQNIPCAAVVPEPLPVPEHFLLVRLGESLDIREALHPLYVVVANRRDLRLLQHRLANPYCIRVAWRVQICGPPRERCRIFLEPLAQAL